MKFHTKGEISQVAIERLSRSLCNLYALFA